MLTREGSELPLLSKKSIYKALRKIISKLKPLSFILGKALSK